MKLLIKLLLSALTFIALLPLIPGIDFHGNFLIAILVSILFGIMLWVVDLVAVALSAVLAISTLGIALIWLIPLWLLGFWFLPAVALKVLADMLPQYLTVTGWMPAILGGLLISLVGVVTTELTRSVKSSGGKEEIV
jgi:hypothetical protein